MLEASRIFVHDESALRAVTPHLLATRGFPPTQARNRFDLQIFIFLPSLLSIRAARDSSALRVLTRCAGLYVSEGKTSFQDINKFQRISVAPTMFF